MLVPFRPPNDQLGRGPSLRSATQRKIEVVCSFWGLKSRNQTVAKCEAHNQIVVKSANPDLIPRPDKLCSG